MAQIDLSSDVPYALTPEEAERICSALAAVADRVENETGVKIGELRYLLVGEGRISELHQQYLFDPSPTDVITFPAGDPTDGEHVEGDIAICLDVARRQARDAGHSMLREIVFLGAHAILHLCGRDDRDPKQRAAMLAHQEELLRDVEGQIGTL